MEADYCTAHYIIGQMQTGKGTVLLNDALESLKQGSGLVFIDPHGDSLDRLLERYPKDREEDLIIYDITDSNFPIAFNPLEFDDPDDIPTTVLFLLESLKAAAKYDGAATVNFDQSINASGFATITHDDNTLLAMLMLLTDKGHRQKVLEKVTDPLLAKYWRDFEKLSAKRQEEIIGSAISQLNMLLLDTRLRNSLSQKTSAFRFKDILSSSSVLLIRLPITKLGKDKVFTLG
jgi:hypothetical protein